MKLLTLYRWFIGTMHQFISQYQNNETFYNQARTFWNNLESKSLFVIIIFIIAGIAFAAYYYTGFNNMPGRHYKPKYWWIFMAVTFVIALLFTFLFLYFAVPPSLNNSGWLEFKLSLGNALYATVIYAITSLVWCNAFPTNAYRYLKI